MGGEELKLNMLSPVTKVSPVTIWFAVFIPYNALVPKSLYFEKTWMCCTRATINVVFTLLSDEHFHFSLYIGYCK